jgi:hypothetical protein
MNTKKLAGIIVACTVAIILVIVIVMLPLMSPPNITKLADQTLIVPVGVENAPRVYFNLDRYGVVRGTIEVVKGESIDYFLYEESAEAGWTEAKGIRVVRSGFEIQLDPGSYYLIVCASRWDPDDTDEERTVSIYLEFES